MKKFRQQQKYGNNTYVVPAVEKYTLNPRTDVCVDADPELVLEIEDWCQRNYINALPLGKVRRWDYTQGIQVGSTLVAEKIVYRFRNTVNQSMFILQFNGEPVHPDATLLPLDG